MRKKYQIRFAAIYIVLFTSMSFLTEAQNTERKFKSGGTNHYSVRFADSEMKRFPEAWQLDYGKRLFFGYTQGLGTKAMLEMYRYSGDKKYLKYVEQWADSIVNEEGKILLYDKESYNIDFINAGKTLLDIYKITGKEKYRLAIESLISQLENHPRTTEGGFWHKKVYPYQMWLDGIFMGSPFMAQYGSDFKKSEWIDEAIHQVTLCYQKCLDEKTGLLHHAWDESKSQRWANPLTGQSSTHWGRSMGWYFMAVVDVLDFVPLNHPRRNELIQIVNHLAQVLPAYRDKNGLWYQVLDQKDRAGNYAEASVSSQFMYAFAKSVNKGYLDKKYKQIALAAFKGIKSRLIRVEKDGTLSLTQCCAVAGLGGNPYRDGSYEYYINEKIRDNDGKATGPFIMGCIELHQ
jgi:unsaturated rhamnogalacturonyl hydrolase